MEPGFSPVSSCSTVALQAEAGRCSSFPSLSSCWLRAGDVRREEMIGKQVTCHTHLEIQLDKQQLLIQSPPPGDGRFFTQSSRFYFRVFSSSAESERTDHLCIYFSSYLNLSVQTSCQGGWARGCSALMGQCAPFLGWHIMLWSAKLSFPDGQRRLGKVGDPQPEFRRVCFCSPCAVLW